MRPDGRCVGYRSASFSIVRDTLWALEDLIDLGFRYDSSIFAIPFACAALRRGTDTTVASLD